MSAHSATYPGALLLLVFNRPQTTRQVWEWVRQARPARLYIAADGARSSRAGEDVRVNEVRQIVNAGVDWTTEVKLLFRERNFGCKNAVSSAIDWFFEHEEEGVILEDDCLPGADFLPFCYSLLDYYRHNEQVMHISGNNFLNGKIEMAESYYFSKLTHIWGWATWRRAWKHYDVEMKTWPEKMKQGLINEIWMKRSQVNYWQKKFSQMYNGEIDTWDYQWTYAVWANNGLAINPKVNLVKNIGFDEDATHTKKESWWLVNEVEPLPVISHPSQIKVNHQADDYSSSFLYPSIFDKVKIKLGLLP